MTYASGANAAIVAASIKAERRIAETLRDAGATSSAAATGLKPDRLIQRGALRRLVRRGVVRQTGDRYWLDEPAWAAMTERRRGAARLVMVLAVLAAIVLTAVALGMRAG